MIRLIIRNFFIMNVQPERINKSFHANHNFRLFELPQLYTKMILGKGIGVFSSDFIHSGDLIESCVTVIIPYEQRNLLDQTILYNYYYLRNEHTIAIALGNGSLYNHSFHPNSLFRWNEDETKIEIIAIQDINPDIEITFNYNGKPDDFDPVWFDCI